MGSDGDGLLLLSLGVCCKGGIKGVLCRVLVVVDDDAEEEEDSGNRLWK